MAYKTILLKGDPLRKEDEAGGTITPGHLLTFDDDGNVIAHNVSGGNAAPDFALENSHEGEEISDTYADGDRVQHAVCRPGDEVYAILAAGESVHKGDPLESDGDGALKEHTPTDSGTMYLDAIVVRALEDKDLSASGAVDGRIMVEVV